MRIPILALLAILSASQLQATEAQSGRQAPVTVQLGPEGRQYTRTPITDANGHRPQAFDALGIVLNPVELPDETILPIFANSFLTPDLIARGVNLFGYGQGFVVSDCHIVTTLHGVCENDNDTCKSEQVTFHARGGQGPPPGEVAGAIAREFGFLTQARPIALGSYTGKDLSQDYAVLRMEDREGTPNCVGNSFNKIKLLALTDTLLDRFLDQSAVDSRAPRLVLAGQPAGLTEFPYHTLWENRGCRPLGAANVWHFACESDALRSESGSALLLVHKDTQGNDRIIGAIGSLVKSFVRIKNGETLNIIGIKRLGKWVQEAVKADLAAMGRPAEEIRIRLSSKTAAAWLNRP